MRLPLLPTMDFPEQRLKLELLARDDEALAEIAARSPEARVPRKVVDLYGELRFPPAPPQRPYTYGSLVLSMDGRMGFPDDPQGPLVAKANALDPDGGLADWWVLNMLRSYADAVIVGARTLQAEPDVTCHVWDSDLARERVEVLGKAGPAPVNVVVSFDGTDIPLGHPLFSSGLTVWVGTSPAGEQYLRGRLPGIPVIATGNGDQPDTPALLMELKREGIERLLVESPSFLWHLAHLEALEELFFNYSGLLAGGEVGLGRDRPFTSTAHPHCRLLTVHRHSFNFLYTRQRLHYLR